MDASIKLIGVYRVKFTKQLFKDAWEEKYGGIDLNRKEKKTAEKYVREELSSIVCVEVLVKNRDQKFDISDFCQPGSDQVAYNDAYLSLDGNELISDYQQPDDKDLRIAFFLHFFNPIMPINTSYGKLTFQEIEDMPVRLSELVPYRPVD